MSEAVKGKDAHLWIAAIKEEYFPLKENQTWILVDLPEDKDAAKCKWIHKIERDCDGNI